METISFYLDERQENFVAKLSMDKARELGIPTPGDTEGFVGLFGSSSSVATFDWVMEGPNLVLNISIPKYAMNTATNVMSGTAKMSNGFLLYSGKIA
ncbi:MAG: hypothetical protein FWG09_01300 [Synergistaceae bacterium]|nr:hypothetical protein [Synergistaceae bacterium]